MEMYIAMWKQIGERYRDYSDYLTFVDTIRSLGGNNEQRFLLIAGYNTDIARTCDDRFVMPHDTAKNKLLVSVHYYTPWSYYGTASGENWGKKGR